jgi:hypothetical protein
MSPNTYQTDIPLLPRLNSRLRPYYLHNGTKKIRPANHTAGCSEEW